MVTANSRCVPVLRARSGHEGSEGKTAVSGRSAPAYGWPPERAILPALHHNPVLAARYAHPVGRPDRQLTDAQARIAVAGSLLPHGGARPARMATARSSSARRRVRVPRPARHDSLPAATRRSTVDSTVATNTKPGAAP